jgi:negative regulator of flagellin synthesis FlgM
MIDKIHGVHPLGAPNGVDPVQPIQTGAALSGPTGISDIVELSAAAQLVAKVQQLPEIRTELVERVKTEIAAGTYETPERLDIAVSRLMDELFGELL